MNWQEYIVSDKAVLLGKPAFKGTSISVEMLLDLLAEGWTEKMILENFPNLKETDLKAMFAYLKDCIRNEPYFPDSRVN